MYLKSIEVQGFKSFANRIKFDFHEGITGIVGPNGSGKSNVADAVRWVLGEQRVKQLRGGSMQDVIFAGTENRRPLSYASVAITLDNADHQLPVEYEEVTVTRKLYRSGESEYLINGAVCRLKDINEMFYDTGIGKEGYSIIGQGQIDKILAGKPEERRELFDEAAGIVKFKRRKDFSLKKLEEERLNLTRVRDILAELEKQLDPLKEQSETAREYLKKREEIKRFDINMFLLESERIREQLRELEEQLQIASGELAEASVRYEEMKAEYGAIEEEADEIEYQIEEAKNKLNETTLLKQQLEGRIDVLKEQIRAAQMNGEHYVSRIQAVREEIENRKEQLDGLFAERKAVEEQLEEAESGGQKAGQELLELQERIAAKTARMEQGQQEIIEILNHRADIRAGIQHCATTKEQLGARCSELEKQMQELRRAGEEQNRLLGEYEETLEQVRQQLAEYARQVQETEQQIAQDQKELDEKQKQLGDLQTLYHREASRLESLKNITERYDGYGNAIRKVMSRKDHEPGLLGVVADLIKVEKEYELAVETALGGSIQNIVTDTEKTAKRMISYLKENKFGRATFLPLTAMRSGTGLKNTEVLKEPGVIGTASALVHTEERFRGLLDWLLGQTVVVDHIDHGIAIAAKYRQTLRLVTLEGELFSPGGSMTGGAFKNAGGLLGRRREIEEMEKTAQDFRRDMENAEKDVRGLRRKKAGSYSKIDDMQPLIRKASIAENAAGMHVEQAQVKLRELAGQCRECEQEQEVLREQISGILKEEDDLRQEMQHSENTEKERNDMILLLQKELEEDHESESEKLQHSEEARLSYAGLKQQHGFIVENINRIEEECGRLEAEWKELDMDKDGASTEILEKEAQIAELSAAIAESGEIFTELKETIRERSAKQEELHRKNKDFLEKREQLSKHMGDLDKECFRLNSRKETLEEAADKQIDYMWEEYELTYSHAMELRDPDLTDLAYMKRQIQALKGEIKKLGDVNVNAIEDYKNVSERYRFLKGQHDDLVEAEGALVKIIGELDDAMRRQFNEQFAKIAREFDLVFRQLFGGGKGTLELMEGEDVLEAGIRIIAQPPGKKLQNMMQLSGGEKALTAISLLFAIQNLKPSPFCLLDEIEAALDDSNVGRFARYLHKLTEHIQFIVITHRRGTMAAADRLYGITMQEKGVSTLISVDLLKDGLE